MNISRNKVLSVLALFLLISMSAIAINNIPVAQGATYQTHLFGLFSPNPAGVGEKVGLVILTDEPVESQDYKYHDYTVTITDPNGNMVAPQDDYARGLNVTLALPIIFDPTASGYTFFVPTMTGTYKAFFNHKTEFLGPNVYIGNNWTDTLVVRDTPTQAAINSYPLPTEYWARPIEDQNSFWYTISSNWMNSMKDRDYGGVDNARVQPDGIAPNTPHIMWSQPITSSVSAAQFSGNFPVSNFYNSPAFANQIIMNGDLYYAVPSGTDAYNGTYRIVDLRTGQVLNEVATTTPPGPQFGIYQDIDSENQHGVSPVDGTMWADNGTQWNYNTGAVAQGFKNGTQWIGYRPGHPDGLGGSPLAQYEILNDVPTFGAPIIGIDGANLLAFPFDNNNATPTYHNWMVRIWNSSKCTTETSTGTVNASATTQTSRLGLNVPILNAARVQQVLPNDTVAVTATYDMAEYTYTPITNAILLCRSGNLPDPTSNTTSKSYTYYAISLSNQTIGGTAYFEGQLMWQTTTNWPSPVTPLIQGPSALGYFTLVNPATGTWYCYKMIDGSLAWGPISQNAPYTPGTSATGSTAAIAKISYQDASGNKQSTTLLYTISNGQVYCYDIASGALVWQRSFPVGFSAMVNNYPVNIGAICDGKIYLGSYIGAGQNMISGSDVRCLNATSGQDIWTLPGWGSPGGYAISDGYMAYLNYYDLNVYTVGRGPSAITVSSSGISDITGVTVTGSVTDASPGSAIKGTAAVSDDSMSAWMANKFMGQALTTEVKGVEVFINVIDSNNNQQYVGSTTTNTDGTYSFTFTPEITGTYQIIATFEGTNGYYPAVAHTTAYVNDVHITTPEPTATPNTSTQTYLLGSTAAIIVALVIAAIVLALLLRRKP